jgi:hypothetical protein
VKRILAVVLGLAVALIATVAVAAWLSSGSGAALATATSVNQAHAPVATRGSGTVNLTWTASTLANGSPVSGYTVLRHAGATTTAVCTTTSPTLTCSDPTPLGSAVTYGVRPTVGAHWTGPESTTTSFTYDNVAPNTTASISPTPNGAGWNNASVTVTLSATDPAISSGVDHVTYTVDGGGPVTVAGTGTSFSVSATGTHPVTFFAVDGAGNTESTKSTTVRIDPNAPLITNLKPVTGASGSWATINCSSGDRVCADVSDVTSGMTTGTVTFGLTGTSGTNSGACWNGSSFVASPCAQQPMSVVDGSQYGSTATLTAGLMGAGNYTLVVIATDVAGNVNTATSTFTVKADQAISFTSTAPASATVGGATYTVTATGGGSGNPVTFTSATTSVCTVSGSTVSFIGAGTCTINANQAGNTNYNAAPQVQQSFSVKADQTISFTSTAPSATVGGATYTPTATSTSGLAVVLTIDASSSGVCTINGGVVSFNAVGSCKIDANQPGNATYNAANQVQQTVTVAQGSQTITFTSTAPSNAAVGGATYTVTATGGGSGNPVTFSSATSGVCTVSGSTVSFVGAGTCTINANQASNANYNAAPQMQQSFAVAGDTTAPTFVSTYPSGGSFSLTNPFSASPCGAGRICATVTDAGTGVASVTFTLTSDNGKCWTGSAFSNGPCSANSMSLNSGTAANGVWRSGTTAITPLVAGNNRGYTLVFTATDVQGNVSTTTVTFTSS